MTSSKNNLEYGHKDLTEPVQPENIPVWHLFEYRYLRLGTSEDEDQQTNEIHIRLPSVYTSSFPTLKLTPDGWMADNFHMGIHDDDEFRLIKNKQVRFSIQDGVMGFRSLDAE